MARAGSLLFGIASLLLHSAVNAETQAPVPPSASDPQAPVVAPPPDPQPKHELQLLVPDGFGGLKKDPPMNGETPDSLDPPNSPAIDPNSIAPDR